MRPEFRESVSSPGNHGKADSDKRNGNQAKRHNRVGTLSEDRNSKEPNDNDKAAERKSQQI
jgi:hypothetical protein